MPTNDEIQRIAAAMNAIRPGWPVRSLVTFLTKHHEARAFGDLAVAGIAVALDAKTETPNLLNQHGPWWLAAQAAHGQHAEALHFARCQVDGHQSYPAHSCGACRADRLARETAADTPPVLTLSPEQASVNARGVRIVRAALASHADHERQEP